MRLLMIGSLDGQLSEATKIAMDAGAAVTHATSEAHALRILRTGNSMDLLMVDVALDVGALLTSLKAERFHVPLVVCGTDPEQNRIVAAIEAGAREYVPLPPDPQLIAGILQAVAHNENHVVFADPAMDAVVHYANQVAQSDASILITGESGTGKEVISRYIHDRSLRSGKAFVSLSCAAIPENLLESELFGHEKGAFTGAVARRVGKFEEADGGTLLLDEVTEMDIHLQAKLLRALQERVIDRVGGRNPVPVDIRVIATSNRDMQQAVRDGIFREDLLYRLNVIQLKLPPLRERPKDIDALAKHFVALYAKANTRGDMHLSDSAHKTLHVHTWPGNVRELENTLHRAVLLTNGAEITEEAICLPDGSRQSDKPRPTDEALPEHLARSAENAMSVFAGRTMADVERLVILDTLDRCIGNRTQAAGILGISIRTLRNKLRQYTQEGVFVPAPGEKRGSTKATSTNTQKVG